MNSRLTLFAVVTVLLAAFAVPALAAPSEETGDVQGLSTRALAKARLALLTARSAKSESRRAARTAQAAMNAALEAKEAKATPGPQGPAGTSAAPVQSASAAGTVTTESESYVQLAGGPNVTVTVPSSGLIEVWAQVSIEEEGAVALFEDGQLVPGQGEFCGAGAGFALLSVFFGPPGEPITIATPTAQAAFGCGVNGAPGSVLFQTTPGTHTYELRYQTCGCAPEAIFSKRSLRVAPRL